MPVVRKSEFADMSGVTKGRVTQWVTAGLIDGAALVGEGRSAMIDVDLARAQLIERRAVNESCGLNGLNTKLGPDAPSEAPSNATALPPRLTIPRLKRARVRIRPPLTPGSRPRSSNRTRS